MLLDRPEKMTVDHLFDIASLTKAVATTTSVMILADRGMIRIDDKVCRYIKDFNTRKKEK
jgi:CubicO group peptidase (beta-lactamase class C family)